MYPVDGNDRNREAMTATGKRYFRIITLLFTAALLLFLASTGHAQTDPSAAPATPVRIGKHADHTRVVFDFAKLTAYHTVSETGRVTLTFDTKAAPAVPATPAGLVRGMTLETGADSTQKVTLGIPDDATFKVFRLLKKIVVDIFPGKGAAKPAAPKVAETKPAVPSPAPPAPAPASTPATAPLDIRPPASAQKTEEAKEIKKSAAEAKKPETKKAETAPAMPALPAPEVLVDAPAAPENQETAAATKETTTRIVIAPIESTNIAVFTRFHTLWIVMDIPAPGAVLPVVSGPLKGHLGPAKTLRFKNGIAFRYSVPPGYNVSVLKHSLTWDVAISRQAERQPPAMEITATPDDAADRTVRLMAPLRGAGMALTFQDPSIGDTLYVVPVSYPTEQNPQGRRFDDLEILPSAAGLVVRPLRDGVSVSSLQDEVLVTAPGGITATIENTGGEELSLESLTMHDDESRLFDFPAWRQGGITRLYENKRVIEAEIAAALPEDQTALLMKLALLYFANNFGQETLGVLRLIAERDPEMVKSPNFIALRGAAGALSGHYDDALRDLSMPALQQHPEASLWTGFAAAATEQWHMANRSFPKDGSLLEQYPDSIAIPFTIYMAESALRLGHNDAAEDLLDSINAAAPEMTPHLHAAMNYLRGEAWRQRGKTEDARALWEPVASGLDRLYHAKASLALAHLGVQEKKVAPKEAVDRIDSLRFAWRGDGLEVQILHSLGLMQARDLNYLQSLQTLSAAGNLADSLFSDSTAIRDDMRRIFADVFVGPISGKIPPLEAVSIYNEFSGLLPPGDDGTASALHFADYLINMDLLDKASTILEEQLAAGLSGKLTLETGTKLAAVYLLDGRPTQALAALDKTSGGDIPATKAEERSLLRARAQSRLNLNDAAVATLAPLASRDAARLKADVLWHARRWEEAADAMTGLVSPTGELDDEAAHLVINSAVGYKLSGNTAKLRALKGRFESAMEKTPLASTFGVVTREGGGDSLADRDTILKIANEVDMFKGFLDNYKTMSGKGS